MLVALQLVGVAAVPLNATMLDPGVDPKFVPVMVTEVPTAPEVGFRLVILGAGEVTVKGMPLLAALFPSAVKRTGAERHTSAPFHSRQVTENPLRFGLALRFRRQKRIGGERHTSAPFHSRQVTGNPLQFGIALRRHAERSEASLFAFGLWPLAFGLWPLAFAIRLPCAATIRGAALPLTSRHGGPSCSLIVCGARSRSCAALFLRRHPEERCAFFLRRHAEGAQRPKHPSSVTTAFVARLQAACPRGL